MKKYLLIVLSFVVALLSAAACSNQKSAQQEGAKTETSTLQLSWKIESVGMDSLSNAPVNRLILVMNGKEESLGNVSQPLAEIPAEEFAAQGIPADAFIACGGFWGGATTNYYALVKGDEVIIMSGGPNEDEETAEMQPFIYEVFRTVKWR